MDIWIIKWAQNDIVWNERTCSNAALNGHSEILNGL